ncbi:hypothetical protein GGI42DRAFT_287099 [Trichoderma sp. SZMC 28013]
MLSSSKEENGQHARTYARANEREKVCVQSLRKPPALFGGWPLGGWAWALGPCVFTALLSGKWGGGMHLEGLILFSLLLSLCFSLLCGGEGVSRRCLMGRF